MHSNTRWIKYWLARTLYWLEKYEESEHLFQQAVRGQEKTLGQEHPDSLSSKHWLARTLYRLKKYALSIDVTDGLARCTLKGNESRSSFMDSGILQISSLLKHALVVPPDIAIEVAVRFGNLRNLEDYYFAAGSYLEPVGRLKGKSNYAEWAVAVETMFRGQCIWYILKHNGRLVTSKQRFDNEVARRFIMGHIPVHERELLEESQLAAAAWEQLKQHMILLCPCCNELRSNTSNRTVILSVLKKTADSGCQNCKCILDGINALPNISSDDSVTLRLSVRRSAVMGFNQLITEVKFAERCRFNIYVDSGSTTPTTGTSHFFGQEVAEIKGSVPVKVIRMSADSEQDHTLSLAASWLQDCVTNHPACAVPDTDFMPDRLVNVGNVSSEPFLIEGTAETAPYAALSYCWGKVQGTCVTKRENLEQHKKSIRFIDMPQVDSPSSLAAL